MSDPLEQNLKSFGCGRCQASIQTPFTWAQMDLAEAFAHEAGWRMSAIYDGDAPDNLCGDCATPSDIPFATRRAILQLRVVRQGPAPGTEQRP